MGPYSEERVSIQRTILFWMLAGAAEDKVSNGACPVRESGGEGNLFRNGRLWRRLVESIILSVALEYGVQSELTICDAVKTEEQTRSRLEMIYMAGFLFTKKYVYIGSVMYDI